MRTGLLEFSPAAKNRGPPEAAGVGSRAWGCGLRSRARDRRTSRSGAKRLGSHSGLERKIGDEGLYRTQVREDVREGARQIRRGSRNRQGYAPPRAPPRAPHAPDAPESTEAPKAEGRELGVRRGGEGLGERVGGRFAAVMGVGVRAARVFVGVVRAGRVVRVLVRADRAIAVFVQAACVVGVFVRFRFRAGGSAGGTGRTVGARWLRVFPPCGTADHAVAGEEFYPATIGVGRRSFGGRIGSPMAAG